jgi:hypothetical protein
VCSISLKLYHATAARPSLPLRARLALPLRLRLRLPSPAPFRAALTIIAPLAASGLWPLVNLACDILVTGWATGAVGPDVGLVSGWC